MNIDLCKAEIKRHEGEVLEIYNDSLGYKTLGVGHLCQPQDPEYNWDIGTPVSQKIVDRYYMVDFDRHYAEAIHVFGSQEDFNKLCFQLGFTPNILPRLKTDTRLLPHHYRDYYNIYISIICIFVLLYDFIIYYV